MGAEHEESAQGPAVFRAFLEHGTDLVTIVEADSTLRSVSPSFRRLLGYPPTDLLGTHLLDHIHAEDRTGVEAAFLEALRTDDAPISLRYRHRHADGSWRVLEATCRNHLGNPAIRGVIIISRDITDQHQTEAQLREREAQYRAIFEATGDGLVIIDLDGHVVEANPAFCAMYGYQYDELLGLPTTALTHPEYHRSLVEHLTDIKEGKPIRAAQARSLRKDGSLFYVEARGTAFLYRGVPHVLGVDRDITERVQAYELLEQRVAERTRELSTLLAISHDLTSTLELQPLLGLILDGLKVLVDYTGSSILTAEDQQFVIVAARGPEPEEHLVQRRFPLMRGQLLWESIGRREPIIIADIHSGTPMADAYKEAAGDLLDTTLSYVRSWMAVPLLLKERVVGLLALSHRAPDAFTARHIALAQAIANQAAVATENARLYGKAQELAVLEERHRLARELHDSVTQALYAISLGARTAELQLERDPGRVAEALAYVKTLAQGGLAEMRALLFELLPDALQTEGLIAALEKQIAAMQARHEIEIAAVLGAEPEASLAAKEAAYRIALEALHNTIKHAQAGQVVVRLGRSPAALILEVRDDGKGFDAGSAFPGHLGLRTMRERATRLGGTLEIESVPGSGTRLRASIPYHPPSSL